MSETYRGLGENPHSYPLFQRLQEGAMPHDGSGLGLGEITRLSYPPKGPVSREIDGGLRAKGPRFLTLDSLKVSRSYADVGSAPVSRETKGGLCAMLAGFLPHYSLLREAQDFGERLKKKQQARRPLTGAGLRKAQRRMDEIYGRQGSHDPL